MGKNKHAVALGRLGGKARAENMTAEQISRIASKAGKASRASLSAEERRQVARRAAKARWNRESK